MNDQAKRPSMEIKKGIPVSAGIAFAPAVVIDAEDYRIPRRHLARSDIRAELGRVRKALAESAAEVARNGPSLTDNNTMRAPATAPSGCSCTLAAAPASA